VSRVIATAAPLVTHGDSGERGRSRGELALSERLSLLLPVWAGDRPDFLSDAFRSSVDAQTRRPDQVVIVRDGPVPAPLAERIAKLAAGSPVPVDVVELERNVGLGPALDAGLAACRHEVVARMDADDISLPHRFAVQLPIIESGVDIVGSGLVEFADDPDVVVASRSVPTEPEEIRRRARFATPFNHPTVVYRRALVTGVGGYTDFAKMEDYLLWAKLILADARVANVAEPLVKYRVGAGAYARRGGFALLRAEIAVQRQFRKLGFTTRAQFARNLVVRGGYRLVPEGLRRSAYRKVIAPYRR
jgi:glycosyltransferase involved in cell wall biosynthesis